MGDTEIVVRLRAQSAPCAAPAALRREVSPSPVEGLGEGGVGSGKPRPPAAGSMVVFRS
ncbi:MAG: hypothetical protein ACHBNF_16205 [Chromatiales bacterium]